MHNPSLSAQSFPATAARRVFLLTLLMLCATATASAQLSGATAPGNAPGSPAGSYSLSGFESVNPFSGRLNFDLHLLGVRGRGGAGTGVHLTLDNARWRAEALTTLNGGGGVSFDPEAPWSGPGGRGLYYGPKLEGTSSMRWVISDVPWHKLDVGYGPGVLVGRSTYSGDSADRLHLSRLFFIGSDGTEHELRDAATGGEPKPSGFDRGPTFVSADGSALTFVDDGSAHTALSLNTFSVSGHLFFPDGTRYRVVNSLVTWIRDRNGNKIDFHYDAYGRVDLITDALGRRVTITYATGPGTYDEIKFRRGNAERSVKVWRSQLADALRTTRAGDSATPATYYQLFPTTTGSDYYEEYNPAQVAKAVELPDGRRYELRYNVYHELARVELPTGGAVEFDYTPVGQWLGGMSNIHRRVLARRVYKNKLDSTPELTETVAPVFHTGAGSWSQVTVEQLDAAGVPLTVSRHKYHGTPLDEGVINRFYPHWQNGREYETEALAADRQTVLRRVSWEWRQGSALSQWALDQGTANNPRVVETKTAVEPSGANLVSKTSAVDPGTGGVGFDRYNNPTDVWEYDYGVGGEGPLLRRTHTDYVTALNVGGMTYDYACDPATACGQGVNVAGIIHLRGLVARRWVADPSGAKRALTVYEYDNYSDNASDNFHDPLVARPGISGHDPAFTTAYKTRGNLTSVTSYAGASTQTGPISAYSCYDIAGNVVKTIDGRGRASTAEYDDRFGEPDAEARGNEPPADLGGSTFAFPTKVTNALGHTAYTQYDYSTGLIVNTEDANEQVTRYEYDDPLTRLTQVVPPAGAGKIITEYGDTPGNLFVKSRKEVGTNVWDEGFTYFDGLGRTVKTKAQDARGEVFSETFYDALGRIRKTCSPYRAGEERHWVETVYDELSRTKEIISPKVGNEATPAALKSEYSAATSGTRIGLVQIGVSQAGKRARSITNALGQLIRVDEPNKAGELGPVDSPTQPTYYTYDSLGNLRKVVQGEQARYFMYDSVGRLIRLRQPEQDTNPALAIDDPVTGNGQWSTGFTYDENGSLKTATDAKGVTITYEYDDLNRVVNRSYALPETADPKKVTAHTAVVTFKYDGALSPTPGDPSPTPVPFAAGALTEVSNGVSTTQLTEFDNLGRVRSSRQITDGRPYAFGYKYNLAGAMYEQTYPSGRVVTSEYDEGGDLSSVSGVMPNGVPTIYASNFSHTAGGAVDQIKLGNGRWETYKTNARGQVTQIALGSSETDTSLWKVNYDYGRLNPDGSVDVSKNDGNVIRQTITVPGVAQPYVQSYTYDSLNRIVGAEEQNGAQQTWRQTFDYDRYGNRKEFSQTVGQVPLVLNNLNHPAVDSLTNRIQAGQGYEYDHNGNLIQDATGARFRFDGDNKQREVRDANNSLVATYSYDGSGRRVRKTVAATGETTVFVYDAAGKLIAEYSGAPAPGRGTNYVTSDILGSPRVIMSADGEVKSRRDFFPFGEALAAGRSADQKYGVGDTLRKGFTGYERDGETGLDFAEARYYNPAHGRFTAVDPLLASGRSMNPQSFNRYAYAGNNPTLRVDPNGLDWYVTYVDRAYANNTTTKERVIEWYNEWQPGRQRLDSYIVQSSAGPNRGLFAVDPFEYRYKQVSSFQEGTAQIEQFKRQAALNFLAGAAEALSLTVELSGALDGLGIERNSGMYHAGQNSGTIVSLVAAASGVGVTNYLVGRFGKGALAIVDAVKVSRTGTVWDFIKATQPFYNGSFIPRSFELTTNGGRFWVHGNATKHFAEYAAARAVTGTPEAVRLATQAHLTSFQAAVQAAAQQGITYGQMMNVGGWELIFQPARRSGQLPTITHALYRGR